MYQSDSKEKSASLEDYINAAKQRYWMIPAMIAVFLLLAFMLLQRSEPSYTATARVAVGNSASGGSAALTIDRPVLEQESELVSSIAVAEDVIANLGLTAEPSELLRNLSVTFVPLSGSLSIEYTGTSPEAAAEIANGFAATYVAQREAATAAAFDAAVKAAEDSVAEIASQSAALAARIEELGVERAAAGRLPATDTTRDELLTQIDDERTSARIEFNGLSGTQRQAESSLRQANAAASSRPVSAAVLQQAGTPGSPDGVPSSWIYIGAVLLGLGFGVAATFVAERLDSTANDREDVSLALGTEVLGLIPRFGMAARSGESSLIMASDVSRPKWNQIREAFRSLRTSIQFMSVSKGATRIIVSSSFPGEGKSVVTANLAVAIAQSGSRVALVNADLRRPTMERIFGGISEDEPGLATYLGGADVQLVTPANIDNLWILPSGAIPANPSELLSSERFRAILDELSEGVEYVLIDSPPVLSTADAATMASSVDGIIIVIDSRRTTTADLLRMRAELDLAGAKVLGAVLNKTKQRRKIFSGRDRYSYHGSK